jgi:HSP20 family molecular chaperone IbpA
MNYDFNNLIDELTKSQPSFIKTPSSGNYYIDRTNEDNIKLIVNVVGHNPKNVGVEVNEGELTIKAHNPKVSSNPFETDVNLTFTIGGGYDGTTTDAIIENGILTLILEKKKEMKSKKIKIKF